MQWTGRVHRVAPTIPGQQLLGPLRQPPANFTPLALHPRDRQGIVTGRLVSHPGDDGGLSPLLDRDALGAGHGPAADRRCVLGHRTGQTLGQIVMRWMKRQERHDGRGELFDVICVGFVPAADVRGPLLGEALRGPLGFELARIRSMVVPGAHTPRENSRRPACSCTTQCSPAALTRRVRAASPGARSNQPVGTVRTWPPAARTVFGAGPGLKVVCVISDVRPCVELGTRLACSPDSLSAPAESSGRSHTHPQGLVGTLPSDRPLDRIVPVVERRTQCARQRSRRPHFLRNRRELLQSGL